MPGFNPLTQGMRVGMSPKTPSILSQPNAGSAAPFQYVDQAGQQPSLAPGFEGRPGAVNQVPPSVTGFGIGMGAAAPTPQSILQRLQDPRLTPQEREQLLMQLQSLAATQAPGVAAAQAAASGVVDIPGAPSGGGAGGDSSGAGSAGDGGPGGGAGGPGSAGDGVGSIFILKAAVKALKLNSIMPQAVKVMAESMNKAYPGSTDLIVPEYRIRACVLIETIARRKDWRNVYLEITNVLGIPVVRATSWIEAARIFKERFELIERKYLGTATEKPQHGAPRCTQVGATKLMSKWAIYEALRQSKKFKGQSCERFWPVFTATPAPKSWWKRWLHIN